MYSFFTGFFPKIVDVILRDPAFWREKQYRVERAPGNLFNFACIVSGNALLELNGKRYELSQGRCFHFAPGDHFQLTTTAAKPLCYFSVHFYHWLLDWEGSQLQTSRQIEPLPFERVLDLPGHEEAALAEMRALHQQWNAKQPGYEWSCRLQLLAIMQGITAQLDSRMQQQDETARLVLETMHYIRDHYMQPIDREQLAKKAALSASYYSTLFKKHTGYSPMGYMNKVRLDRAKQLLRSTRAPVSQIAREIGYTDPLYFTRLFTKEIGMSPRQFRNG